MLLIIQLVTIGIAIIILLGCTVKYFLNKRKVEMENCMCASCEYCSNITSKRGIDCKKQDNYYLTTAPLVCNQRKSKNKESE